jgi:Tfp pilus assembly protein PilF
MKIRHLLPLLILLTNCASNKPSPLSKEDRAELYLSLAIGALQEGDSTGALQSVLTAEQNGLKSAELFHTKALAYYFKRDLENALVSAKKTIEVEPKFSQAHNTLGKILMDLGKADQAIPYFSFAAKDPLNREAYKARTSLGIVYYRMAKFTESLEQLDVAIREEPRDSCLAYYYRGHLRIKNTVASSAILDYKNATKPQCGPFEDAHFALGLAYENNRQIDLAKQKFLEIQKLYPGTKSAQQSMLRLRNLP